MQITHSLAKALTPTAIALGNFDGIHRGHQAVLQPILGQPDVVKTVLTFDPHPRQVLGGTMPPLLTSLREKLDALEHLGIEQVILLPFTPDLAQQSPTSFCQTILQQGLAARYLSVGANFRYGHRRQGDAQTLQAWGEAEGITVFTAEPLLWQGDRISSSRIREALHSGDVETVTALLGRPYTLTGEVVSGQQQGRKLGFPTANLALPSGKLLPQDGVYVARLQGREHDAAAVVNIGMRPTVAGKTRTVEAHVLDWSGDLYGQTVTIALLSRLRAEEKFTSLAALQAQIATDCDRARRWHHCAV